ncbi:MAG: hypothetical protein IKZ60_06765 [Bacteroidales bacterium]|nr:hypothetical protein [Bacteroidales bacterium]
MKKLSNLALVGTMVLAAAACQREQMGSSSVEASGNGVKEVTTQFVLNVASAPQTKMSADVVQMKQNFRGMDNAKLYVYNTGMIPENPGSTTPDAFVLKTNSWTEDKARYFDMGTLLSSSSIDNESTNNNDNSSNRVLQLSVPVGVDAVLFYGKAIKGNNAESYQYGGTNMTATQFSVNPAGTVIAAQKILDTDAAVASYDATGALMIYIINSILSTSVDKTELPLDGFPGSTYPVVVNPGTSTETISYTGEGHRDLSWDALGHQYEIQTKGASSRYTTAAGFGIGRTIAGLEEVLGRCYFLFTDIKAGEYRTGSSGAVKRMISDMYKVISDASQSTPTNEYEANAKRLANAILNKAEDFFFSPTATNIPEGYSKGDYQPLSSIQSAIGTEKWNSLNFNLAKNLNKYPYEEFRIPRGAAQLAFGMEKQEKIVQGGETVGSEYLGSDNHYTHDFFYYLHPNQALVSTTPGKMFDPRKYMHPAELWYYVNSPIRTTNKEDLKVGDYPNGVNPWKNENSWTANAWEAKGKVKSSTRGVAVKNNINYGVALLKSSVLKSADTYKDNRKAMTDNKESDRIITKNDLRLTLTGVLVGGVNPRMDWQFVRKYASGEFSYFDGVIYDSSIANETVPTPAGEENYTLVYDNFNSTDEASDGDLQNDQNNVRIALEFKNQGDPFWGKHNLIPTDGFFYLVAEVPAPTTAQINGLATAWPNDHQIPPVYGVDGEAVPTGMVVGESKKIARVFMQDFMTEIKFNLVENSLKNAYYTMPDLRASQMSLGLSVDLQWIPGLVYSDINL